MAWLTTKDGRHFNTDWLDDKERQISENTKQVQERQDGKSSLKDSKDLLPKNSYTNTPEYKKASKWLSDTAQERQDLNAERVKAYKELEEARNKHLDKDLVAILGKSQARALVNDKDYPDTAEARNSVDRLLRRTKELEDNETINRAIITKYDTTNSSIQREEYGRPKFKEASGNYRGFKTKESTVSGIDSKVEAGTARVVEMTPEQYIHECAHYIFHNSTVEKTLNTRVGNKDTKRYANMMRSGTKFDTPYINYKDEGQEGLHRAVAAYMAGIEKMPVIIVGERRK